MSILALLPLVMLLVSSGNFAAHFTGKTLRLDYFHSGIATEEHISLDQVRLEGDWPGSKRNLSDDTNLGKYLFEIIDYSTNQKLYSRGFCSIYGEWETTGEAVNGTWRTFHESKRFPEPKLPFQFVLKKRGTDGAFHEIYTVVIDPKSRFVNRAPVNSEGTIITVFENGPATDKVDVLMLGDGYTAAEKEKFKNDAKRLGNILFNTEPFKNRKKDFNLREIHLASERSGISNPRKEFWNKTPLGLSFNSFDSDRYVLTFENKTIHDVAAQVPYDALIILANTQKYGGGGIFNLYTTAASQSNQVPYLIVHEFGHSFAGLADEYYTSSVAYEKFDPAGTEPWEPNNTAMLDPKNLKWKHLVENGTPIPTPWNQAEYDNVSLELQKKREQLIADKASEQAMEALFSEVKEKTLPMLQSEKYAGKVGAFEGAGYQAKGLYRPTINCIMFSRDPQVFCPVCAAAIERVIDLYTKWDGNHWI